MAPHMIAPMQAWSEQSRSTLFRDGRRLGHGHRAQFSRNGEARHCPNRRRLRWFGRPRRLRLGHRRSLPAPRRRRCCMRARPLATSFISSALREAGVPLGAGAVLDEIAAVDAAGFGDPRRRLGSSNGRGTKPRRRGDRSEVLRALPRRGGFDHPRPPCGAAPASPSLLRRLQRMVRGRKHER